MPSTNRFYSSISKLYDYVFPYNPKQLAFIKDISKNRRVQSILDIGCGTGNLALALAQEGYAVSALDADPEMIALAEEKMKKRGFSQYPEFHVLDMMKLTRIFSPASFDMISCFGNTLPHLLTYERVETFLDAAAGIIKKEGHLAIQLLNYDYIVESGITELPLKDNENIRFERYYEYPEDTEQLHFITRLTDKQTNQVIENQIPLLPVRKNELKTRLEKAGFTNISFYGGFDKSTLSAENIPLVVDCAKK